MIKKTPRLKECESCSAGNHCPLSALEEEEFQRIELLIGTIYRPQNAILFEEGDSALDVYLICQGEVEQIRHISRGGSRILLVKKQGDCLGVEEVLAKRPSYFSTARVLQDALIRVISRAEFLRLLQSSPQFCLEVIKGLALQMLSLEEKLTQFMELPAHQRLLKVLAQLAQHYGRSSGEGFIEIDIPITNLYLAEQVGVTPETLSSLLSTLKRKGLLKRKGRRFFIRDPKKLIQARSS
jgi:CRP-like cAMP-binding protein